MGYVVPTYVCMYIHIYIHTYLVFFDDVSVLYEALFVTRLFFFFFLFFVACRASTAAIRPY